MEVTLESIKDKHKGKTAVVVVLGPSLNQNLAELKKLNDNENLVVFTCNMFDKMIDIKADYWLVCAPMKPMYIASAHERINNHGATFLFANRIPGFSKADAAKYLTTDYIPVSDISNQPNSLQQTFAEYTGGKTYGPVDTVLLHLIALSVYTGCDDVYIAGADLNYSKGYVKNGVHRNGESIGKVNMDGPAKNRTVSYANTMRHSATNVGTNIYTLNPNSPLSIIMGVKTMGDLKQSIDE